MFINSACVHVELLQSCLTLCDPMECNPPDSSLSMGFSSQEYWSGLPCPPPGDSPDLEIKSAFLTSATLADRFFTTSTNTVTKGGEILETFHCD